MGKRVLNCGQYGKVSVWAWSVGKWLLGPGQLGNDFWVWVVRKWVLGSGHYGKNECLDRGIMGKVSAWSWTIMGKWVLGSEQSESEFLGLDNWKVSAGSGRWESECLRLDNMGKRVLGPGKYGKVSAWSWTKGKLVLKPEQWKSVCWCLDTIAKGVLGSGHWESECLGMNNMDKWVLGPYNGKVSAWPWTMG